MRKFEALPVLGSYVEHRIPAGVIAKEILYRGKAVTQNGLFPAQKLAYIFGKDLHPAACDFVVFSRTPKNLSVKAAVMDAVQSNVPIDAAVQAATRGG